MTPQKKAFEASVHSEVECGQCHKDDVLGPSNSRLDKPKG